MPRRFASNHTHNQTIPSATWTISHGLNCKPAVAVQVDYEGSLQVMLPASIQYIDNNTVVIGFTSPFSGSARLT